MTQTKARLNTDIRKKIGGLILSHFENEKTTELENFVSAKQDIDTAYSSAFKIAQSVVSRAYPKNDVATLQAFKKKYGSACDVVAKDSCFYFANTEMKTDTEKDDDVAEHFDFKMDASLSGRFDNIDFGIAYYRNEIKNAGINPEINIQQKAKENWENPNWTQEKDKIKKFLGINSEGGLYQEWKDKFSLDVIGTSYCRTRTIPCFNSEFNEMKVFKLAKESFVNAHYTWAENIFKDMRDIHNALKDYKYIKDAIDLCGALGLDVNENKLQRTAGVSLTIYQPENLANLIKSRRAKQDNKSVIEQFKKARQVQATVN